ncbi:MAG: hypothetical protein RL071_2991 [Pseudomonadota bacterium]|jgi:hypothetical protein
MSSIIGRLSNLARGALLGGDDDRVNDPAVEAELAAAVDRGEGAALGARRRARAAPAALRPDAPPDPAPTDGPAPPRVPRPRTL